MTRKKRVVLIVAVSVLVLAFSGAVVYAGSGISSIEELFYAFRSAQTQAAVESGDMTQGEADEYLGGLTSRMEEDENDAVPPLKGRGNQGGKGKMQPGHIVNLYAGISGLTEDEICEALKEGDVSLFAMADDAGLLDELKAAMIEDANANIDEMVDSGKMDADRAAEIKEKTAETINAITADTPMRGKKTDGPRPGGGPANNCPSGDCPLGNGETAGTNA